MNFNTNIEAVTEEVKNWIITRMAAGAEYRVYTDDEVEAKKHELEKKGIEMFVETIKAENTVVMGCRYIESKERIIAYKILFDISIKENRVLCRYEVIL